MSHVVYYLFKSLTKVLPRLLQTKAKKDQGFLKGEKVEHLFGMSQQKQGLLASLELSGKYESKMQGTECSFELISVGDSIFKGSFQHDGDYLDISATLSRATGYLYGFLLEPTLQAPIAFFRAKQSPDGLALELDVPDFDELIDYCQLERISLQRAEDFNGVI